MRILFATTGAAGHGFPLVPLAAALADQGHRVGFATSPGRLAATLSAAGFAVTDAGIGMEEAYERLLTDHDPAAPPEPGNAVGEALFGRYLPRAFADDLIARLTSEPVDLVVAETGCPGATLAAYRTGTPCVVHAVSRRLSGRQGTFGAGMFTEFAELAGEYGVEVPGGGSYLAHRYLNTFPASLDSGVSAEPPALAIRPVPWNPPATDRPRRPRADRPWIYLTFGTAFDGAALLRPVAEELAGLDADILIAAGGSATDSLDGFGERVRVEPFVPQADLMGEFALAVHHGGSGTTLAAAASGVPQLVLPLGADQHGNADAVAGAGIGRRLDPAALPPGAVGAAASELLAPGPHRAALSRVAAEIAAMPAPAEVAAGLDSWARP